MKSYNKKGVNMLIVALIIYIGIIDLTGCKVRQVDLQKQKVETHSETSSINKSMVTSLDTSKIDTKVQLNTLDTSKIKTVIDSSLEAITTGETTIYSNGKNITIGPGQTFTGPADSTKMRSSSKSRKATHKETNEAKGLNRDSSSEIRQDNFKSLDSLNSDSLHNKQDLKKSGLIKHTISTPSYGWIWYVAALIGILIVILYLYEKINGGWITGIFNKIKGK